MAPRVLRDFARLLSLVKAVTVLRHRHRQLNSNGWLVAELADYQTVRELVAEMYQETTSGAVAAIRSLVEAVQELDAARGDGERITATKLANRLGVHKSTAGRRATKALRQGWLVNRDHRHGYPADYALGELMPVTPGLPTLEDLARCRGDATATGAQPSLQLVAVSESKAKTVIGCAVAGVADGKRPPTPAPGGTPKMAWRCKA